MIKTSTGDLSSYTTKDGSTIRELMHPRVHGNRNQSLAEAVVETGSATRLHVHPLAEEIYHFLAGEGIMVVGEEQFPVARGDTVCIPPGTAHHVRNTGNVPLRFLCCSSPPYSHEDTVPVSSHS